MALSIATEAPDFALSSKGAYGLKIATLSENLETFGPERNLGMGRVAQRSVSFWKKVASFGTPKALTTRKTFQNSRLSRQNYIKLAWVRKYDFQ
jgi:hypothetical protein